MANVLPLFKKGDRQVISNYRPVSLLPSISKICEKIVFIRLYNYLNESGYFYHQQSGFRPGNSTVMQLIHIVDKIANALEKGENELRAVFLDISKAFDRVWHKGLLVKLGKLGITGSLYKWLENYLQGRCQRVVVDGVNSEWRQIHAGVPQGSVLGPLFFLIYINDIATDVTSDYFLFADDSLLLEEVSSPHLSARKLNNDLETISNWSDRWLVTLNASKTKTLTFSSRRAKPVHPPLYLALRPIEEVASHDHLGVTLSCDLSWHPHILKIHQKASKRLNVLKGLRFKLKRFALEILYKILVRSTLEYADVVWGGCLTGERDLLEGIQLAAARVVTGARKGTHRASLLKDLSWHTLENRRSVHKLVMMYKMFNKLVPLFPQQVKDRTTYSLRSSDNLSLPKPRTERFKKSFIYSTIQLWNELSDKTRQCVSLASFRNQLLKNCFRTPPRNYVFYIGDRYPSIIHTRLRLGNSALNAHLFSNGCISSPLCYCGISNETVEHFLLSCPRFAALRVTLLTFAAQKLGKNWLYSSKTHKIRSLLYGCSHVDFQTNMCLFKAVQMYIIQSARFTSKFFPLKLFVIYIYVSLNFSLCRKVACI